MSPVQSATGKHPAMGNAGISHPGVSHRQAASVAQPDSVKVTHCPHVGAVYSTVIVVPLHIAVTVCGPQPISIGYVQPNPDCQFQLHALPLAGKTGGHSGSGGGGLQATGPDDCQTLFTQDAVRGKPQSSKPQSHSCGAGQASPPTGIEEGQGVSDGGGFEVEVKKQPGASMAVAKGASVTTNGFASDFLLRSEGISSLLWSKGNLEKAVIKPNWAIRKRKDFFATLDGANCQQFSVLGSAPTVWQGGTKREAEAVVCLVRS